ncbi:hypothetical protein Aple_093500 [Acrocarpospora pleiomorpha]|uniref:Uncharacterized protein n=1 Tax=Acrocarpospora pleiomorpha TaxID=90975 RepID=A0A5M3Y3N9_9ACTN|nr:hypothetical protein Aple_093500 [Acrocarpospora pleiomorpha]
MTSQSGFGKRVTYIHVLPDLRKHTFPDRGVIGDTSRDQTVDLRIRGQSKKIRRNSAGHPAPRPPATAPSAPERPPQTYTELVNRGLCPCLSCWLDQQVPSAVWRPRAVRTSWILQEESRA